MTILNRGEVKRLQRAALASPFVGDGTERLADPIRWRRSGLEGGAALSFNR
jgi:hypothetical protein